MWGGAPQRQIDYGTLGQADFNLKAWINSALGACPPQEPIEVCQCQHLLKTKKHTQALNIKLQQMMYELSGTIDEKSSSCVLRIPGYVLFLVS